MKLKENYHTHTYRCGHASFSTKDEDYVKEAIKYGIEKLGFSDHAPFPNITHFGMRMEYSEFSSYLESINSLKEKYKDKIKIYSGLEIEYYEEYDSYYQELLKRVDYLILGQHVKYDKDMRRISYFNSDLSLINYKNDVIKAMKTHYFKYLCHPDLFMLYCSKGNKSLLDEVRDEIIKVAIEEDIPLEINLNGFYQNYDRRKINEFYPSPYFFNRAKELGCKKFILGIDCHSLDVFTCLDNPKLEEYLKILNIDKEDLIEDLL